MQLHKNYLIGMVHLPSLLSYENFQGMSGIIDKALRDLYSLEQSGFDAVLVDNEYDYPCTEFATPAQVASFSVVANEVTRHAHLPVGVQMMLNDWESSITIAKAVDAQFTRIDVFVDDMTCRWGTIRGNAAKIMKFKRKFYPELMVFTDIQAKCKNMIDINKTLEESAQEAMDHGSDAIVVTGSNDGIETPLKRLETVRKYVGDFPLLVGGGLNEHNASKQLKIADGAIVGTSIKTGEYVDSVKASRLRKNVPYTPDEA